ncbi:MAG: RsmE family RNA methyltransferase, partial [Thiovulaceae bacterium]|nr:RsmE family RNA methyltransferase [Sulfurimonadaceae bacterium]
RIILNSMQQSGRFDMLQIQSGLTLETFVKQNPDALVLDFCETPLKKDDSFQTVILGPEGGFSEEEKELLEDLTTRKLQTPMVLRSETAAIAISSMMLL